MLSLVPTGMKRLGERGPGEVAVTASHTVSKLQRVISASTAASLCESASKAMRIRKCIVRHSVGVTTILLRWPGTAEKLLPSRICLANLASHLARVKGHRLQDLAVEQPYVSPLCGHGDSITE